MVDNMATLLYGILLLLLSTTFALAFQQKISLSNELMPMRFNAELITDAPTNSSQCTELELECSSCSLLSISIATSAGLIVAEIECNTTNGEYCNPYRKSCSARKSYCSTGGGFQCHHEGRFPHPFECNVYYVCSVDWLGTLVAEERICPPGTSYNAKTYRCDGSANDPICQRYPVPECPDSPCLDINPLPQNPNIFYTCENGVPQLYKCVEGEDYTYDPALFQCTRNESAGTTSTTTEWTYPTIITEEPDNSTYPDGCLPHIKYHVPYTCGWYYYCPQMPSPTWYFCGAGKYFNRETDDCVEGVCPYEADNKAVCNGVASGAFPIPRHCNSRYECSNSVLVAVSVCSSSYYFDRELKQCVQGSCPYEDF